MSGLRTSAASLPCPARPLGTVLAGRRFAGDAGCLANASVKGVSGTDVLSGFIFFFYTMQKIIKPCRVLYPHLPGSSALVLPALQAPRHSCRPSQGKVRGFQGFGVSRCHCPQVTCKLAIQRLFPPSFIWRSPGLNHTCLADGIGGRGAKAGAGTAAWGHPQKCWRCSESQFKVNISSCPLHAQGPVEDCTKGRPHTPHSHPPSPSGSAQAKMSQQHPGIHPSRNTVCFVIPVLDLGTEHTLVCPGDAAAGAAPDLVTLKCWCCREPPQHLCGGCANQQHLGVVPGVPVPARAPPGAAKGDKHLEQTALPFPGQGLSIRHRGSTPLAAAAPSCACRAGGKHLKLLPAQTHHLAGKLTVHRDCRVLTRSFVHPTCICCTQPSCRQGSSTHHPALPMTRDSPWPGQQLIRRVPCRLIGWVVIS